MLRIRGKKYIKKILLVSLKDMGNNLGGNISSCSHYINVLELRTERRECFASLVSPRKQYPKQG